MMGRVQYGGFEWVDVTNVTMYKKWGDLNCTKHQGLWQCWIVLADVGVLKTARK